MSHCFSELPVDSTASDKQRCVIIDIIDYITCVVYGVTNSEVCTVRNYHSCDVCVR